MSDSAQSSGLKARVGHLDISSALPDSLVQLVGDSLKFQIELVSHPFVCFWSVIPRCISVTIAQGCQRYDPLYAVCACVSQFRYGGFLRDTAGNSPHEM